MIKATEEKIINALNSVKEALAKEGTETKDMILTFMKSTQGKATDEEMSLANKQFQDLLKTLGFGALVILPFAPVTIPLVVKFGKKFGVDIIPGSFKKDQTND